MTRYALVALTFTSACVDKVGGESDDDGLDTARLHDTCEAWCQVAVPCSDNFAEHFEFSTQTECEESCIFDVEHRSTESTKAPEMPEAAFCFDIILDVRECAAALTCEEFKEYENWSFGEPSDFPPPCLEEQQNSQKDCNF